MTEHVSPNKFDQIELSEEFQMGVVVDLHAHSSHAGGTSGSLDLSTAVKNMPKKGVKIIGTGDCLYPPWVATLKAKLVDHDEDGVFEIKHASEFEAQTKFVLQTELAFTAPIGDRRKNVHGVFLFPSFDAVDEAINIFKKLNIKNSLGRPFITNNSTEEVAQKIHALLDIDPLVEFFPAHVLVPLGIYGANPPIEYMSDFFGDATERFHAFETGLSADPTVTALIPELDKLTLLSNSDAHSAQLHRLGRELTSLDMKKLTIKELIDAIRRNKVCYTAEFHPSEGRYFLTGHKAGVKKHNIGEYCVFSPDETPDDRICPICGDKLQTGVLQRAIDLATIQGSDREYGKLYGPKRNFYRMVPLVEVLAFALNVKSPSAKSVTRLYNHIVTSLGTECKLWTTKLDALEEILSGLVEPKIADAIIGVRKGHFCFEPPGYDGVYGELVVGKTSTYKDIKIIESGSKKQLTMDDFMS
jgi:PHP family Zn ribbon phosphoesterase